MKIWRCDSRTVRIPQRAEKKRKKKEKRARAVRARREDQFEPCTILYDLHHPVPIQTMVLNAAKARKVLELLKRERVDLGGDPTVTVHISVVRRVQQTPVLTLT